MRDPLIGTQINRYEIREPVHKSDVISIYKAYDTKLDRFVLLKTILHSGDYSKEAIDFFLAESRTLAKLVHPNIAKVLDFGYESGNLYLISEYVLGQSLTDLMHHPMSWQKAINILLPLTNALMYAHSRGIIHRDLKPDNIIINTDDQPILSDFSLMRIIEEEETRDMTGTTAGLGSPEYISPEQGQGLSVDFRSDIYSLGVIFFEMVTGKKLFYAPSSMEIVMQHIMADPPKPRSIIPTLPKMVETVILNALSKDPGKRYQTMEEFSNAMKAVVDAANKARTPSSRRPRRLFALSIAGVLLAMVGIGWALQGRLVPGSSATPSALTPRPSPTALRLTPTPDAPTEIPSPSSTPEPPVDEVFGIFKLPIIPVLPGTQLPDSNQVIDVNNAGAIQELARWGKPVIHQLAWINRNKVLLAATSAGMYYFDPQDLSARMFFDSAGSVSSFTISDDDEWIATTDAEGAVTIWSLLDGKQIERLEPVAPKILSLDFAPDKSKLVLSDNRKNIYVWDYTQNQDPYPLGSLSANANRVLFSNEGKTVISGGDDFEINIWDVASAKPQQQFYAAKRINDMAISSDGRYLALALSESIQVWDLTTKTPVNEITGTDYEVFKPFTFVAFMPNEGNLLTASADGYIHVWNTLINADSVWRATSAAQEANPLSENPVRTVAVSSDGTTIVVGFETGLVELWNYPTRQRGPSSELGSDHIGRIAMSPDDRFLAFQRGPSTVEVMSLENSAPPALLPGSLPRGNPISPDNHMLGIQAADVEIYSLPVPLTPTPLFTIYDFPINGSMNYSPDSKIVTAFSRGALNYWSTVAGWQLKASVPKAEGRCRVIYRRDDGLSDDLFIAAGSDNGVIHSTANLEKFCQVSRNPRTLSEEFLPDGSIIALALQNQRVEVWDFRREDPKITLELQTRGDVLDVAISKDGNLLAAASEGGVIELFNLETLEPIKVLNLRTGAVLYLLFSNQGDYLVSGSADGTLRFFGLYR